MDQLTLNIQTGSCSITVGDSIGNIGRYVKADRAVIITDSTVRELYGDGFPPFGVLEIGQGESCKTLDTVHMIYRRFKEFELDRSSLVIGIGGGIVCDISGFAASTYLRGLPFAFVPTTLLAQCDASIGGKNGVNLDGYKNLVGTFRQPQFVLCDASVLKTLPKQEFRNGLAEAVKQAVIGDETAFQGLERNYSAILALDESVLQTLILRSIKAKTAIVMKDERESGVRRILNFGHTLGHAIEKANGLPHGEAISIGMVLAARLSVEKGLLPISEAERIEGILRVLELPTEFRGEPDAIIDAVAKDKKRTGNSINFVLLERIGRAKIMEIGLDELEKVVGDHCRDNSQG